MVLHYGVHLPVEAPASTKRLFFLDVGQAYGHPEIKIQFHMVSL